MAAFKDSKGKTWVLDVTVGDLLRVKAATRMDLLKMTHPRTPDGKVALMTELSLEIDLLCGVVFELVKPQAEGIEDVIAFTSRLGGEALKLMHDAFWEGIRDFFQSRGDPITVAAIDKQMQIVEMGQAMGAQQIGEIDAEAAFKTLGKPSSGSPGSLALTPAA